MRFEKSLQEIIDIIGRGLESPLSELKHLNGSVFSFFFGWQDEKDMEMIEW